MIKDYKIDTTNVDKDIIAYLESKSIDNIQPSILDKAIGILESKGEVAKTPINNMIDSTITEVVSAVGSFVIRKIKGRFMRSITFTVGSNYSDKWIEDSLYNILYTYNNIKRSSELHLAKSAIQNRDGGLYYRLAPGTPHYLNYRGVKIILIIQEDSKPITPGGRPITSTDYTIITYNLDKDFVENFKIDMINNRNNLLKIHSSSPTINVYRDGHESDGWTWWEICPRMQKRRLNTIYLPRQQKELLVHTINRFFAKKNAYREHGVLHNLKILLHGPPGPQPITVDIPTPSGLRKFGDLEVGDEVFDLEGRITEITNINSYKSLEVFEVEFNDCRKVLCGIDHNWPTITSRGGFMKRSVRTMLEEGIYDADGKSKFKIPMGEEVQFSEQKVPIDPWVLGVFIGNGSLKQKKRLTLSSSDEVVPSFVADILGFDFKKRSADPNDYNWVFYHKNGNPVIPDEFFSQIPGLIDSYSRDKVIPEEYLINSIDNRYALLQGLMDTDGSITETKATVGDYMKYDLSFSSTSRQLLTQVQFLINSLGFSAVISDDNRPEKYVGGYCGSLQIRCNDLNKHLFFNKSYKKIRCHRARFQKHNKQHERNPILTIKNIKSLGYSEDMRCIEVRDQLHLYQTTGFIPTCNSGKDSLVRMIASEWGRNLFYVTGGKNGKFIPDALTSHDDCVSSPLFLVSDIDKYPYLINDTDVELSKEGAPKEESIGYKQQFQKMLNALDGVMSGEDRIIIMTTNHVEKFSPVFLRSNRVDLIMEVGYITPEVLRKYVYDHYSTRDKRIILPNDIKLKNEKTTVADMQFDVLRLETPFIDFVEKYCELDKSMTKFLKDV